MKIPKSQIGIRAQKTRSDEYGYCFWYFDFVQLSYDTWGNQYKVSQNAKTILTVKIQMDKERGHSLFKAYGVRIEFLEIEQIKTAIKILKELDSENFNKYSSKSLVNLVRKYERIFYYTPNRAIGIYVPCKWKNDPETWVNAMEKGYSLTK